MPTHDDNPTRVPPGAIWGFQQGNPNMRLRIDPILAIGSNLEVCRAVSDVLAGEGYWVEWTTDLTTAPTRVSGHRYALLVAEAGDADGTHAPLAAVAEIDPALPVLLLVGEADADAPAAEPPAGVHVLAKPFEHTELLARVRTLARTTRTPRTRG
jgi:DNA-binding response OmpR family regulator